MIACHVNCSAPCFLYIKIYFLPKFCPNEICCFLFELILTISSENYLFPQYFPVVFRVRTTNKVLHTHWSVNPTFTTYKVSKLFGARPVTPDVGKMFTEGNECSVLKSDESVWKFCEIWLQLRT